MTLAIGDIQGCFDSLLAVLDGHMEPAAALAIGHVGNRNGATEVERGQVDPLEAMAIAKIGEAHSISEALSWLES